MIRFFKLIFLAAALSSGISFVACGGERLVDYVEPRIGTAHCRYFHFAPGSLPFGMAKPGPSTNGHLGNRSGWEATGYDYRDGSIEGFPCAHEFQVGGITLMATRGGDTPVTIPGRPDGTGPEGYRSAFSHEEEFAMPGYYSVLLKDYGIKAELTATERVAYQRFTFPADSHSRVIFNIGSRMGESGAVKDAKVEILPDGTVEGWVITLPEYVKKYQPGAEVPIYFSASLDKVPSKTWAFNGADCHEGDKAQGVGAGLCLEFGTSGNEAVTVKVGISFTSVSNARLNRETESGNLSFDKAKKKAVKTWEDYLGRIRVKTDVREDKVKFYTGLYHALLGRGVCSDINGAYPKHDGSIGQIPFKNGNPEFKLYNTDGIWGGQWNLVQLWAMAYPEHLSEYITSHLQVFKDSGWLGDGLANSRYVSGVGTNLLSLVIAAAYECGIRDFDIDLGYEACRKNELEGEDRPLGAGKSDTDQFVRYGYVPHLEAGAGPDETFMFSASHTLEYSYSAFAVAQLARQLGHQADYELLTKLSKGWEHIYDDNLDLVRPKLADGRFIDNFDPMQVWRGFQEGNAWQYTFYVPHDVDALVGKVGPEVFNERLDSIFTLSRPKIFSGGTVVEAFAGLRTLYNHGNQPCLHISWLFNDAGRPSLTQKWVRAILDEFYGTDGIHGYGYGQDEDQGQLGAWYVMSSLGLFDVGGLTAEDPSFGIGSPLFDKVIFRLNRDYFKGRKFKMDMKGNSKRNIYVKEFSLNGKALHRTRLQFRDFAEGGHLRMTMSDIPSDNY